jgi:hypothetical protein
MQNWIKLWFVPVRPVRVGSVKTTAVRCILQLLQFKGMEYDMNMIWIWIEYDMEYEMDFENSRSSFVGSRSIYSFWPTRWHRWFWLGKQEGRSVIAWLCFMVFPLSKLCGVIQISKIHVVCVVFGVEIWRVNHEDSRKLNCKPNPFNYPNWPCGGWC